MLTELIQPLLTLLGIEFVPSLLVVLILITLFKD